MRAAAQQPGFGVGLLQLLAGSAGVAVSDTAALQAAVTFKNHVKARWAPEEGTGAGPPVPEEEKGQIRGHITALMLSTAPLVQAQIAEALSLIARHDFPERWPTLMPELVAKMAGGDMAAINGCLSTAASIFEHIRNEFRSDTLYAELKYILDNFVGTSEGPKPFLELFKGLRPLAEQQAQAGSADGLRAVVKALHSCAEIFYSLNSHELPAVFEDTFPEWMGGFHFFLEFESPLLQPPQGSDDPAPLTLAKASICECLNLFVEKDEDEFKPYLTGAPTAGFSFCLDIWNLLTRIPMDKSQDRLVTTAIKFLTNVCRGTLHSQMFGSEESLKQLVEKVALPNMQVRDEDEELFEMNFIEYIRRDIEGNDTDTRRRSACELVKRLTEKFPQQVTSLCSNYVNTLLGQYTSSPPQFWKAKDCALYLVTALTVMGKTEAKGATETNNLVQIGDFFNSHVVPELKTAPGAAAHAMLQADSLKFLVTFRSLLPKEACLGLMGDVIGLLASESNVVHSYAALCIERMLALREGTARRYSAADIASFVQPLLTGLFGALSLPESEENEYVMKCIMRVIATLEGQVASIAGACMQPLSEKLLAVAKNPINSNFNHFLFEAVAALIHFSTKTDPALLGQLENSVFPVIQVVLQEGIEDFEPYVFQIMAQLVQLHTVPLPPVYISLFQPLLQAVLWERSGNVPGLVHLLQAYLAKAAMSPEQLGGILGVFQKLLASKTLETEAFFILNALFENLSLEALGGHVVTVFNLLLQRLHNSPTSRYARGFVLFFAFFVCKHSPQALIGVLEQVQPDLFTLLVKQVFISRLKDVDGDLEEKLCVVAATKILCEVPAIQQDQATWTQLLGGALALLAKVGTEDGAEDGAADAFENKGYSAGYTKLHFVKRVDIDPLKEVTEPKRHLATHLSQLSQQNPGRLPAMVATLPQELQQALQGYCQMAGSSIA